MPEWVALKKEVPNGNKLFESFDIDKYNNVLAEYEKLTPEEKTLYKGKDNYFEKQGGFCLTANNRHYKLLMDEVKKRLESDLKCENLIIDGYLEEYLIQDLLASLENENYIRSLYKQKKMMVASSGLTVGEATIIMDCIRQGRSLLEAGKRADMLAKPLIDFYAASAYAYAIIVIHSPLHKSLNSLKRSHGHTYNHENKTIDFGGEHPRGTFIDFLASIPVIKIQNKELDLKYSIVESLNVVQNANISFSLLTLLSMVPELNNYYSNLDKAHKVAHKLSFDTSILGKKVVYNFYIGDGMSKPQRDRIERSFKTQSIEELQGGYKISVDSADIEKISPTIYQDIKGDLWYIENPIEGLVLPEICLHFLIISGLCSIMRYSPNDWNNVLNNKISSQYSLLISEYIRLFEKKFPMLVIQYLTNYLPMLQSN